MAFRLGLTGGIACGKTTASRAFASLGIPVIDADLISRSLTAPGSPILEQIFKAFGSEIKNPDGSLNRSRLRAIVFADDKKLEALNNLLQGAIRERLIADSEAAAAGAPYVVLAIPLLFERHLEHLVDRILVLDAPEEVQLARIIKRDGCSPETARSIMNNQVSRAYRLSHGDDLIDTGSLADEELSSQIVSLHRQYLKFSDEKGHS